MSDRRLKRILRENQLPVQPKRKEEMLEFARECDGREKNEELEDGSSMKYMRKHKFRTLIAAAVILSLMAVAVTAGIVNYYYRTPGGKIFDQSGAVVEDTGNILLKMTGEALTGEGYTIEEVIWVSCSGQSTFTVWMSADSRKAENLRADIDGVEYPLTESFVTKDKNGNPLCIAYTAYDIPEPQNWSPETPDGNVWLRCDDPFISSNLFFEPTDIAPVYTTSGGITVTGYTHDGSLYIGADDDIMKKSTLNDLISSSWGDIEIPILTDTSGTVQEEALRHGHIPGSGGIADICYSLGDVVPASVSGQYVGIMAYLAEKENVTYCDIPIPEIGETLTGEWTLLDVAGMKITITEITRDKYAIVCYSPDEVILYNYRPEHEEHERLDDSYFAESLDNIIIHSGFGALDGIKTVGRSIVQPAVGRKWRVASKEMNEYCENHDTIRMEVSSLEISYRGDWTLTFPEN